MVLVRVFMMLMLALTALQPMQTHAATSVEISSDELHCAETGAIGATDHKPQHHEIHADHDTVPHDHQQTADCCMVACCPGHAISIWQAAYAPYFHSMTFPSGDISFTPHKPEAVAPPPKA